MSRSGSGGRSDVRSTTGRETCAPHAPSRTRASASAVHRASPPGPSTCRSLRRGRDGVSGWGKTGGDVRVPRRHPREEGSREEGSRERRTTRRRNRCSRSERAHA
jgi:hypothetical protein